MIYIYIYISIYIYIYESILTSFPSRRVSARIILKKCEDLAWASSPSLWHWKAIVENVGTVEA